MSDISIASFEISAGHYWSVDSRNVFSGATLPYGMAKAVADTDSSSDQGGFVPDGSRVTGFSSMHDSGTGGSPSLGNFPLFPYAACMDDAVDGCIYPKTTRATGFFNESVEAQPGYFALKLNSSVKAEMTTTEHTSLFRFSFPQSNSTSPLILLDLTDLSDSRQDNASVTVNATSGRMTGLARFLPSFGSGNYTLSFCADFSGRKIRDSGIFVDSRASTDVKSLEIARGINGSPLPGGAFVRFEPDVEAVLVRVGLSFIGPGQACMNAEKEIPKFGFEAVRAAAASHWRAKLSPISISTTGVHPTLITNFFSGIYRTMVSPQNYTGENPLWASTEPYFDSFYCIWDSFRSQLPLLTILDPHSVEQMVRALIDIYRHDGWLPDCRMSLCKGYTQGGSNADNVIADAFVKNLTCGINYKDAYDAVKQDAEVEPYDWSNEGRGGLDSWHSLGYVPVQDFDYKGTGTHTRSISRTLEYSYNDFCISQLAAGLNMTYDVAKYRSRSRNWRQLFKPNQTSSLINSNTSTGFMGFFQPKFLNQTFAFQDPLYCSNIDTRSTSVCSLQDGGAETFESSIWEYSFFVPHDQASLIKVLGGPDPFVRRLDYLHDQRITYIGNEPAFLTVFQYHYAGRPGLSAKRSHFYIPSSFSPTEGGLPGNDDSGAMGSFLAFSMMGLFPNPGQDVYLITPPYFESVNITSPLTGKTAVIRNVNYDPSYQAIYVQSATLNGEPHTKNWIDHSFFTEGKELVLTLGLKESTWGTKATDLPPSLSIEGLKSENLDPRVTPNRSTLLSLYFYSPLSTLFSNLLLAFCTNILNGNPYTQPASIATRNGFSRLCTTIDQVRCFIPSCLAQTDPDSQFNKPEFSDVRIQCGDQEFAVHKVVICSLSEHFAALMRHDYEEKASGIIVIEEQDPAIVKIVLEHLYGQPYTLPVLPHHGIDSPLEYNAKVYVAADYFDVATLKDACTGKFAELADECCNNAEQCPHLWNAIKILYNEVPKLGDDLRDEIIRYLQDESMDKKRSCEEDMPVSIATLAQDIPQFRKDLANEMISLMTATAGWRTIRCTRSFNVSEFSDLTITSTTGVKFFVHKIIVCAQSAVLKTCLTHESKEKASGNIDIAQDTDVVQAFLEFLYGRNYDASACSDGESQETLLFHSRVFAMGAFYDVPLLRRLAEYRLNGLIVSIWSERDLNAQFSESVRFAYEHVINHDRRLHDVHVLAVRKLVSENKDSRLSIDGLFEELPQFGSDVASSLIKQPNFDDLIKQKCQAVAADWSVEIHSHYQRHYRSEGAIDLEYPPACQCALWLPTISGT
ncbi:MAG: hypothetical protein M1828_001308 [Chrysothrix sp. TS-e1954]|nr:MAG: hypothetical protein M1828_001308 [Chrysothrix sp. TS-e1954]